MLSVLFATEVYYTINENNNEETQIAGRNWEKLIRPSAFKKNFFFAAADFHFADSIWEKLILCWHFLAEAKKSEFKVLNQYLWEST